MIGPINSMVALDKDTLLDRGSTFSLHLYFTFPKFI